MDIWHCLYVTILKKSSYFCCIISVLCIILLIKKFIDSLIFQPVFAETLKAPQNPLLEANSSNSLLISSGSPSSSTRSALLSTKIQGNFPPSLKEATSSIASFQYIVLLKFYIY